MTTQPEYINYDLYIFAFIKKNTPFVIVACTFSGKEAVALKNCCYWQNICEYIFINNNMNNLTAYNDMKKTLNIKPNKKVGTTIVCYV